MLVHLVFSTIYLPYILASNIMSWGKSYYYYVIVTTITVLPSCKCVLYFFFLLRKSYFSLSDLASFFFESYTFLLISKLEVKFLGHCLTQNKLLIDISYYLFIVAVCKRKGNPGNCWIYSLEERLNVLCIMIIPTLWALLHKEPDGKRQNKELVWAQKSEGWQCQETTKNVTGQIQFVLWVRQWLSNINNRAMY